VGGLGRLHCGQEEEKKKKKKKKKKIRRLVGAEEKEVGVVEG
jgi:hypothetical protein